MKKTKVTNLTKDNQLIGIKVETEKETFTVPVIDVRRGARSRSAAGQMQKAVNAQTGSKFFKPSYSLMGYSYNMSRR